MPTRDVVITQEDFSAGMFRDLARHLIPPNGVYDLPNRLLDDSGSAYRRAGTANKSNAGFGSAGLRFLWDGYFDAGRRTVFANPSDFGVLASDDATPVNLGSDGLTFPAQAALIESLLFIGGGYIYGGSRMTANYSTGTVTLTNGSKTVTGAGTTWNTLVDAGMLLQRGNERVYAIASVDSTTQVTLTEPYEGVTGAGVAYTFRPIYKITAADPYETSSFYCVSQNRLVWATGNRIRYSEIKKPHDVTNVFGTDNEHTLPEGVQVTGLAAAGSNTLIFTTGGLWVLQGLALDIVDALGNPLHRLNPLSRDLALFGSAGIATWDQLIVAPGLDAVYLVDGVSAPLKLSRNIDPLYRSYVKSGYRPGQAAVFLAHYFLPILNSAGAVIDVLVCRLDRGTSSRRRTSAAWSHFNGSGGKVAAYAVRTDETNRESGLLGASAKADSRLLDCSYFTPQASRKNDADGSHFEDWITTRDFATGPNGTRNAVRKVRSRYELVDAGTDDPVLYLDYGDGGLPPNIPVWGDPAGVWGTGFGPLGTSPWTPTTGADLTTVRNANGAVAAPEDDGRHPFTWKLNKKMRFVRVRVRSSSPAAYSVIRSLALVIRPSGSDR